MIKQYYDLVILTTALNRPEIHLECINGVVDMIKENNLKVKWFINIDVVIDDPTLEETITSLKKIFSKLNNCSISYMWSDDGEPCFFDAVKRLVLASRDDYYNSKYGVLYLEDDWTLKDTSKFKESLNEYDDNSYIQLTNRVNDGSETELTLNPSIWGKNIFKKIMIYLFERHEREDNLLYRSETKGNPERFVSINFQYMNAAGYGVKVDMKKIPVWEFNADVHPGRRWMKEKGLIRHFKATDKDGKVSYKSSKPVEGS
tara:strand:- start:151 stop:927 length:777 start_codon:yes stop_codon:yes gene_type:complete